jgi:hypothetical protein
MPFRGILDELSTLQALHGDSRARSVRAQAAASKAARGARQRDASGRDDVHPISRSRRDGAHPVDRD